MVKEKVKSNNLVKSCFLHLVNLILVLEINVYCINHIVMIVSNKGSRDKDDAWSYSAISARSSCTLYQFVFSLPLSPSL